MSVVHEKLASVTQVKVCPRCHQCCPLDEFYIDRTKRDGHSSRCRRCFREAHGLVPEGLRHGRWTADRVDKTCSGCGRLLQIEAFGLNRNKGDGHQTYCRECNRIRQRNYREQHLDTYRERGRTQSVKHREKRGLRRHGLKQDSFAALLELQHGVCAICGATNGSSFIDRLFIDHDHKTGEIRGLLCHGCNAGRLGRMKESVEQLAAWAEEQEERARLTRRAIEYLMNPPARGLDLRVPERKHA